MRAAQRPSGRPPANLFVRDDAGWSDDERLSAARVRRGSRVDPHVTFTEQVSPTTGLAGRFRALKLPVCPVSTARYGRRDGRKAARNACGVDRAAPRQAHRPQPSQRSMLSVRSRARRAELITRPATPVSKKYRLETAAMLIGIGSRRTERTPSLNVAFIAQLATGNPA